MSRGKKPVQVGVVKSSYGHHGDTIHGNSVVIIYDEQNEGTHYDCGSLLRGCSIPVEMVSIVTEPAFAQAAIDLENAYGRLVHHQNQFLGYENYPDYPNEGWFEPLVWQR